MRFGKVLVTGGCGFIGSAIVDLLVEKGCDVRVFDLLEAQVHGGKKPAYINQKAEYVYGDIRDKELLKKALDGVEVVFHEAAAVGMGQSMYEIAKYVSVNTYGTALLLDTVVNGNFDVKKMLVAASMSSYGEGAYKCEDHGVVYPGMRSEEQLERKEWEQKCPYCKKTVVPVATGEEKPFLAQAVYALSKRHQEEMFHSIGRAYGIPSVSLRYFNVYGPRQSLSNPYTGVCAIFSSRIKNNNRPVVYEDGLQTRDFVYVRDVARANLLCMEKAGANYQAFNVGSGSALSIRGIAQVLAHGFGKSVTPKVTDKYRKGDVRHCFADISKIRKRLGFVPETGIGQGFKNLICWGEKAEAVDSFEKASKELEQRGLV